MAMCWLRQIGRYFRLNVNSTTSSSMLFLCSSLFAVLFIGLNGHVLIHSCIRGSLVGVAAAASTSKRTNDDRRRWTNNMRIKIIRQSFPVSLRIHAKFYRLQLACFHFCFECRTRVLAYVSSSHFFCAAYSSLNLQWRTEKLMIARRESNCTEIIFFLHKFTHDIEIS